MDSWSAEARAVWAVAVKELRQMTRYKIDLSATLILPVFQFLVPTLLLSAAFLVGGRPAGFLRTTGTTDVAAYFVLGAVISAMTFGAFWGAAFSFRREQLQGTLEPLWLVPTRPHSLVAGYALANFTISMGAALILFALSVAAFGSAQAHLLAAIRALPFVLLAGVAMIGIAYLMSAAVLLLREPNVFVDVGSFAFQAFSGVNFPVTMLPGALVVIPYLLPTTYALDLLRVAGLGTHTLAPPLVEVAALAVITLALVPFGAWIFTRTERRIRRTGSLGQY